MSTKNLEKIIIFFQLNLSYLLIGKINLRKKIPLKTMINIEIKKIQN